MDNPFKFGKEVEGYQFYDRVEACEELYQYLNDGSANVVLYAPRRYGKTSMVLRVLNRFRQEGTHSIHFDLSRVSTIEKFCEQYVSAVYSLNSRFSALWNRVSEFLSHLHPSVTFGTQGTVSVKFDYGSRMNEISLAEVLNLPERLAAACGNPKVVVAFDEFQDIAGLNTDIPLEEVFRSVIQGQKLVRYVFFGSKTHLMRRMFGEHSRPFYKSAMMMKIGKPPVEESREFIVSRFENAGLAMPGNVVERIVEVSENIPYYLQAVSRLTFRSVEKRRGDAAELADVEYAIREFVEANGDLYEEILRNLSVTQRALIEALAMEPVEKFDEPYRKRHGLGGSPTVHSALRQLVEKGHVESDQNGYALGDPFFARYIRTASPVQVV